MTKPLYQEQISKSKVATQNDTKNVGDTTMLTELGLLPGEV